MIGKRTILTTTDASFAASILVSVGAAGSPANARGIVVADGATLTPNTKR